MITMRSGDPAAGRDVAGIGRPASETLSRTKMRPSRRSTRQHEVAFSAGAASASPVRRLKQAWCQGQRTVSPTISPSPSGPP